MSEPKLIQGMDAYAAADIIVNGIKCKVNCGEDFKEAASYDDGTSKVALKNGADLKAAQDAAVLKLASGDGSVRDMSKAAANVSMAVQMGAAGPQDLLAGKKAVGLIRELEKVGALEGTEKMSVDERAQVIADYLNENTSQSSPLSYVNTKGLAQLASNPDIMATVENTRVAPAPSAPGM